MKKKLIALRLEEELVERISAVAIEGNVSQWIRLLIKKELEPLENEQK